MPFDPISGQTAPAYPEPGRRDGGNESVDDPDDRTHISDLIRRSRELVARLEDVLKECPWVRR
jgi:hypothetical protein